MNPSTYYRQIAAEITDSDTRKVLQVMSAHIGGDCSIELDDLSQAVFGTVSTSSTRKARMVLEQLVKEYEIPIGAYSGKSGRVIIADDEERWHVVRELQSRQSELHQRARVIMQAKLPANLEMANLQTGLF
jgi:hypothetical protein